MAVVSAILGGLVKKAAGQAIKSLGLKALKSLGGGVDDIIGTVAKRAVGNALKASGIDEAGLLSGKLPNITRQIVDASIGSDELDVLQAAVKALKKPASEAEKNAAKDIKKRIKAQQKRIAKVEKAQEKARALIDQYQRLGWDIKPSIIERANRRVPWNITERQAEAMIDNLSPSTIKTLRTMKTTLKWEEYNEKPKVSGHQRSGANIYDVDPYATHEVQRTVEFGRKQIPRELVKQIKFVMDKAPSSVTAREIWEKLELFQNMTGVDVLEKGSSPLQLVEGMKGVGALRKAAEAAEKEGNPGYGYLLKMYDELVNKYGFDEYGIAAKQARDVRHAIDVGAQSAAEKGDTTEAVVNRRTVAANVVKKLINMGEKWQNYREQYRLRFSRWHAIPSSFDTIDDVVDAIMEEPDLEYDILDKMEEAMDQYVDPMRIKETLDEYLEKHRFYSGVFAAL